MSGKHRTGASSRMAISAHCQLLPGIWKFFFCRLLTAHFSEFVKSGAAEAGQLALLVFYHIQAQWSLLAFPEKRHFLHCPHLARSELLYDYEIYKENKNPKSSLNSLL